MGTPDFILELLDTWKPLPASPRPLVLSHLGLPGAASVLRMRTGSLQVGVACPQLSSLPEPPRTLQTLGSETRGLYELCGPFDNASSSRCLISF